MTKIFCDICKKETTNSFKYKVPGYTKTAAVYRGEIVATYRSPIDVEIDICDECRELMREKLNIYR